MPSDTRFLGTRMRARLRDRGREDGLTLTELLVAVAVAAVVLSAATPWAASVSTRVRSLDARAQAGTAAAYAARALADDLSVTTRLVPLPAGAVAGHAVAMRHDHPGEAVEQVLVSWDSARQVLWRNASGTYLADHVEECSFTLFTDAAEPLAATQVSSADLLAQVVRVHLSLTVAIRTETATVEADLPVGPL